jgi:predicted amino acid racemase
MVKLLIHLDRIQKNAEILQRILSTRKISLMAVTKVFSGDLHIAETLVEAGVKYIGDSRLRNIILMKNHEIDAKLVLIRIPAIHEIPDIVAFADYSVQSEMKTIKILNKQARIQNKIHNIILMVDSGDMREGIPFNQVFRYVDIIRDLPNVKLKGIATNLKCFGGVIPDDENMTKFSRLAEKIEEVYDIQLEIVSAGNSANFQWLAHTPKIGRINNLRIGEALFFGWETIDFRRISGLYSNNVLLKAQIVEIKERNIVPKGTVHSNAFGEKVTQENEVFKNHSKKENMRTQMLLNIGRQDVDIHGLTPVESVKILGASSDYLVVTPKNQERFSVGQNIRFKLNYSALMHLTVSPYIGKKYIKNNEVLSSSIEAVDPSPNMLSVSPHSTSDYVPDEKIVNS